MPIIDPTPPAPPTKEERLQQRAESFTKQLNNQFKQITNLAEQLGDFIWDNKDIAPQQAFNLFGKNAADLLKISAAYSSMIQIYTGKAPVIVPPGFQPVPNADGTVTVKKV